MLLTIWHTICNAHLAVADVFDHVPSYHNTIIQSLQALLTNHSAVFKSVSLSCALLIINEIQLSNPFLSSLFSKLHQNPNQIAYLTVLYPVRGVSRGNGSPYGACSILSKWTPATEERSDELASERSKGTNKQSTLSKHKQIKYTNILTNEPRSQA